MKKLLLIIIIPLCGLAVALTACPAPPSIVSGVRTPNAIIDESENTIVVYQVNEGDSRVTYIQRLGYYGNIVWEGRGKELYSEPGPSEGGGITALLVSSKYDQTVIVWEDTEGIQMQKIDAQGRFHWEAGITIAAHSAYGLQAAGDGEGDVIIGWSDDSSNLYLQRIDFDGNTLWKTVSLLWSTQYFNLAVDDEGNVFIVWEDKDYNTYVQKLNSMGKPCWVTGGILLSDLYGTGDRMNSIISDGTGGAIIAWIHAIRSEDNSSISGCELYVQRISAEGEILWETDGVAVITVEQSQIIFMPVKPQLIGDGVGGAFLVWSGGMSIFAQRISAAGEILWVENGVEVWDGLNAPRSPYFSAVSDDSGGFIVVWNCIKKGKTLADSPDLRAQRYNASGEKSWDENGIRVTDSSAGYISPMLVKPDGKGGAIVSWAAGVNMHNAHYPIVQRVYYSGLTLWSKNGTSLGWQ